jgi:hypothetical protein
MFALVPNGDKLECASPHLDRHPHGLQGRLRYFDGIIEPKSGS